MKMTAASKKMVRIGDVIGDFITNGLDEKAEYGFKLQAAWKEIAPSYILKHTTNIVFKEYVPGKAQTVLVFFDDNACMAECRMEQEIYKVLLASKTGLEIEAVKALASRDGHRKINFLSDGDAETDKRPPVSRSKMTTSRKDHDSFLEELDKIDDENLKKALQNAFERQLG